MDQTRAIAWNTGVQAAGKVLSTALGVAIIALMTRHLGTQGFGYYATANAFFQIFALVLDLGINVMIVQMLGEHKGDTAYEHRAVSATMTLRILTALILFGIAPFIGLLFPYALPVKLALFAIWISFFCASLNQVVIGVQQRHLKMHIVAIAEIIGRAILFIGLLTAIWIGWGLIPIVLFVSLGSAVNLILNWGIARKYASFAWNLDLDFWKELLTRSWPIGVSILFNLLYFKGDIFILSLARSAEEVGIYSAAYRVLEILITFPFMLAGVTLPLMAHAWKRKQKTEFKTLIRQSFQVMALIALPLVAGTMLVGTQAMIWISGPEFVVSGTILKILALATGLIYIGTISSHVVVAIDAQRKMLPIYIIVAIITLILYILLIPPFGIWAAAWLTVFSEAMVAIASSWFALKAAPGGFPTVPFLKTLLATVLMSAIVWPLRNAFLPIPILAGMISYTIFILLTGAISKRTVKHLLQWRQGVHPME